MRTLLLLVPGLLLASPAFAAAGMACRYEGTIVSLVAGVGGVEGSLAIGLKVSASAAEPPHLASWCAPVGETIRFRLDEGEGVIEAALEPGDSAVFSRSLSLHIGWNEISGDEVHPHTAWTFLASEGR